MSKRKEYLKEYYLKNKDKLKNRSKERYLRTRVLKENPIRSNQYIKKYGDYNFFELIDDYIKIFDYKNNFIIIDKSDKWLLDLGRISIDKKGYASVKSQSVHRLISKPKGNEVVDHINRMPFDNRKSNLRNTNKSLNAYNQRNTKNSSTPFVGVSLNKRGKFNAYLTKKNGRNNLGTFDKIEDAWAARKIAELNYFGEMLE